MPHNNIKNNKWSVVWLIVCFVCLCIMCVYCTLSLFVEKKYVNYVLYVVIVALGVCLIFGANRSDKLFKTAIYSTILTFLIYCIYYILSSLGILQNISIATIRDIIKATGAGGVFAFLGITILQVIVLPIPSSITILAGAVIYGPTLTFLISTLGIAIGSLIAFVLGRVLGKKIIYMMFNHEKVDKYSSYLGTNGGWLLFTMFLLPFFPDDMLCMLAGVTTMNYKKFIYITLSARAIGVASLSYFGSGSIIPFRGWGLVLWAIIIVTLAFVAILIYTNKKKFKAFLKKITSKSNAYK